MQGRRQEIKGKIFLIGLILFSLSTWLYAKRDLLFEEFKQAIEKTISHQLHARVKVGRFDGGFLRKISFKDLSVSDEANNFQVKASRASFNFRVWDILFKKYKSLDHISLGLENVAFFRQDFRLPIKVSQVEASLSRGLLEIRDLRGFLDGEIPFQIRATVAQFSEPNPKIEISCRFLSSPLHRTIPVFLPAVIYLNGDLQRLFLKGSWEGSQKETFDIEGDIQPSGRRFEFVIYPPGNAAKWTEAYLADDPPVPLSAAGLLARPSRLVLSGDFSQANRLNIKLSLDHLRLNNNEVLANIFFENEFIPQQNLLQGRVYSSGSVLNYLPLPEFEGFYKIRGGALRISSLKLADSLLLSGNLNFTDAVSGNLLVLINNFNLANFARIYYPQWNAWGTVQGKIKLNIKAGEVTTKGNVDFSEGELGPFKFKGGRVALEGQNSILRIMDSRVYQEHGYMDLTGEVNLKKLGNPDFGKKLVLKANQDNNMNWRGWNVSRKDDSSEISFNKDIDEKFNVGFKSYMNNSAGMKDDRRNELDLEYKLKEDKNLKIQLKENEELLGVEHKVKF